MADLSLSDALSDSAPPAGSEALVEKDFVASLEAQSFEDEVGETVGRSDYHPLLDKDDNAPEGKSKGGAEPVLENGEQEAEKSASVVGGQIPAQHQEVQREVLAKAEQQLIAADFLSGAFEISGLPERWGPHPVPLQPADCSPVPPVSQEALKASETTFSSSLPLTGAGFPGEVATNIETTPLKMEQTWNLDDSQKPLSSPVAEPPKLQAPPSPMSQPQTPAFDTPGALQEPQGALNTIAGAAVTVAAVESPSQMEQKQGTAEPQKPPSSPGAETPKQQVPPLPISQPQTHAPEPPKLPSPAAPQEPQTTQDTHAARGDPCTSPGWMGEGGLRPDLPLFTPSVSTVISRHASQAAEGSQRQSATGGGYAAALGEDRESEVAERKQQQKKKKKRRPRDEVPETFHTTTVPQGSYTESSPVAAVIPRAPPRREEGWEREEGGGRAGRGKKGKGRKRPQEDGAEREWGVPQESHVPALAHMPKVFPPSTPEGSREVEKEIPGIGSLGQVDKEPVNTLSKQLSPGVPLTDSSFPSPEKDPVLSALVPSSATATLIEPILSPPTSSLGLGDTATTLPQKDVPPTSSVDQQPPPFSGTTAPLLSLTIDSPTLSPQDVFIPPTRDAPALSPQNVHVDFTKDAPPAKDAQNIAVPYVKDPNTFFAPKDAHLPSPKVAPPPSPKDAPVPSAKDAPLLCPKDSPVPSAKDAPLPSPKFAPIPSPKDAPLPSPKDAPVPSAKDAPLLCPKDSPVPSAKDSPLPSPKFAPLPSPKDAPLPSPKDAPVSSAKDAPLLSPKDAPVASAKEAPLLSPKDAPLLSPKDAPVPSAKDAPLLSPKDSPVPSAKDAPLLSPKDAPVASAKEAPLLSPKDAPLLSPKDAPVASAKEAPLPSPKSAPVPSAKDAPLLSPKDAPLPSAKDVFAPSIEQHPAFTPTSSAPTSPAATAGPEPSSSIEMLPKDSTAPSPKDAPASSAKQLLADPTSTAKHPTSSVKRASSSRAKQQNSLGMTASWAPAQTEPVSPSSCPDFVSASAGAPLSRELLTPGTARQMASSSRGSQDPCLTQDSQQTGEELASPMGDIKGGAEDTNTPLSSFIPSTGDIPTDTCGGTDTALFQGSGLQEVAAPAPALLKGLHASQSAQPTDGKELSAAGPSEQLSLPSPSNLEQTELGLRDKKTERELKSLMAEGLWRVKERFGA